MYDDKPYDIIRLKKRKEFLMATVKIEKLDKQGLLDLAALYGYEGLTLADSKQKMIDDLDAFGINNEYLTEQENKAIAAAGGAITTETIGEVPEDNSVVIPDVDDVDEPEDEDDDEEYVTIRVPKSQANAAKAAALPRGKVLMKMVRENFYYEVAGYAFSKEHPFVLVDSKTADYLTEKEEGFRPASPKEAADFYS